MLGDGEGRRRLEVDGGAARVVPGLEIVLALREQRGGRVDPPSIDGDGFHALPRYPLARIEGRRDDRFSRRVVLRGAVAAACLRRGEQIARDHLVGRRAALAELDDPAATAHTGSVRDDTTPRP